MKLALLSCAYLALAAGQVRSALSCCSQPLLPAPRPARAQLTSYHPFLAPEPADPTCAVKASVYLGTQYFDALALSKPTASPVPTVVMGAITFQTENLLTTPIEVRRLCLGCWCAQRRSGRPRRMRSPSGPWRWCSPRARP